jgi:hypothetical protein
VTPVSLMDMVLFRFDRVQDLVSSSEVKYLYLVFRDGCQSSRVKWIKLDVEDMATFVVLAMSHKCLLVEALSGVTQVDVVFSCIYEFILTLGQPTDRKDILPDVLKRIDAVCDDAWRLATQNLAQAIWVAFNVLLA